MPQIDDGGAHDSPGRQLRTAWVTLSHEEGLELRQALEGWFEETQTREADSGWHTHITDAEGYELTIAIEPAEDG
jgi:hypothetical protein